MNKLSIFVLLVFSLYFQITAGIVQQHLIMEEYVYSVLTKSFILATTSVSIANDIAYKFLREKIFFSSLFYFLLIKISLTA